MQLYGLINLYVLNEEKYRPSGKPFCSEAKLSDEKALAQLAGWRPPIAII